MAEEQENDEVPSKPSKLPLIIASVVCLVLGGGGGYAAATFLGGGDEAPAEATEEGEEPEEPGTTIELGEFTVNLRNTSGRMLQMEVSILVGESLAEIVAEKEAKLKDSVLLLASDYTPSELDGESSLLAFRDEIHTRVNGVLSPEEVREVYLTRLVVQ